MDKKLAVVGLGPGGVENIPQANINAMKDAEKVFLRTLQHPGMDRLKDMGIKYNSFDELYEKYDTFEEIYERIADILIEESIKCSGIIVYAVPGNPVVAESSVDKLLNKASEKGIEVKIMAAAGGLEAVFAALKLDPTSGIFITDALNLEERALKAGLPLLITQVYNGRVASDVKLTLMEHYNSEHPVTLVRAAGVKGEEIIKKIPLYEVDRVKWIDHLTTLYVPASNGLVSYDSLTSLVEIMDKLRGPDGCPWDKQQTHESLKRYLVEETYEVIEAIEENNMNKVREELGDLLLQIVFHAKLAKERGDFTIEDVIHDISEKMVRRHPHVFKDLNLSTPGEVVQTWEKIKDREKMTKDNGDGDKSRVDVPRGLPALLRAEKVQTKAARVGFDWPDISGPWDKIYEELEELKEARDKKRDENIFEEMGDLLFAIVNTARFLKIDAEEALQFTINKFIKRFKYIEKRVKEKKCRLECMTLEELDKLWNEAKNLS